MAVASAAMASQRLASSSVSDLLVIGSLAHSTVDLVVALTVGLHPSPVGAAKPPLVCDRACACFAASHRSGQSLGIIARGSAVIPHLLRVRANCIVRNGNLENVNGRP